MTAILGDEVGAGQLDKVLEQPSLLSLAFQPVVDVTRVEVVGYEVLARLPGDAGPGCWFRFAEQHGRRHALELLVLSRAVAQLASVPRGRFLSVNLSTAGLMHPRVLEIVEAAGVLARRLVLELTDDVTPDDLPAMREIVAQLRRHGVMLAADSVPLGDEGLDHLIALAPDLVKLDGSSAAESGFDPALIEALAGEHADPPAWLVATGVETPQDLVALAAAGIPLAQGYVIGHPEVVMTELSESVREVLESARESTPKSALGALAKSSQVALTGPAVAVDGNGCVVGVVVPTKRGGVEVRLVTLAVHPDRSLADVAREAMRRPIEHRYDPVVVTDDNGHVVGVIGTDDLMLHLAALADATG